MRIRPATVNDIDTILTVYDCARQTMRDNGNDAQWINGYPSPDLVSEDIEHGESYVIEGDDGLVHGVFMFALGDDPTYNTIEDGAWLNDEPYGVIHRIGTDGRIRGALSAAVDFALQQTDNLRIDTHARNNAMRCALSKAGFRQCGTIYCQDGTARIAFHLCKR